MVVKSPWLPPATPGEFIISSLTMLASCVLYASFIGNSARRPPPLHTHACPVRMPHPVDP
eukprot:6808692-Prymnesium_polylepis.1